MHKKQRCQTKKLKKKERKHQRGKNKKRIGFFFFFFFFWLVLYFLNFYVPADFIFLAKKTDIPNMCGTISTCIFFGTIQRCFHTGFPYRFTDWYDKYQPIWYSIDNIGRNSLAMWKVTRLSIWQQLQKLCIRMLESFHLYLPNTIFYNLSKRTLKKVKTWRSLLN